MKNIWYDLYQETQNWREKETKREEMIRVQYIKCKKKRCNRRKNIGTRKKKDPMFRILDRKKEIIERSMVEYWSKKGKYIWRHNSQSTLGQWCDRDIYKQKDSNKAQIQAIEAKETSISEKCKQYK